MATRNHYQVLGVLLSSSTEDIKKAYRKIAMQNHPDRNPDNKLAEARFLEATEAYKVLLDPNKREEYNKLTLNRLIDNPRSAAASAWNSFISRTLVAF